MTGGEEWGGGRGAREKAKAAPLRQGPARAPSAVSSMPHGPRLHSTRSLESTLSRKTLRANLTIIFPQSLMPVQPSFSEVRTPNPYIGDTVNVFQIDQPFKASNEN